MADQSKAKTVSERLFEEYLNTNHLADSVVPSSAGGTSGRRGRASASPRKSGGLGAHRPTLRVGARRPQPPVPRTWNYRDWEYEPPLSGQTRRPDYLLRWQGNQLLFEVKELRAKAPPPNAQKLVASDPCASLRSEINEARRQFKALKDYCCSLVVHNVDDWTAKLDHLSVFSAMLGDFGFQWAVRVQEGQLATGPPSNTFLDGGKMIRPQTDKPQNTTISCVIVLQRYRVPDLHFERRVDMERLARENQLPRPLSLTEDLQLEAQLRDQHVPHEPEVRRVTVIENPFARHPLPNGLFCGDFDERWRLGLQPECAFLGQRMAEIRQCQSEQK